MASLTRLIYESFRYWTLDTLIDRPLDLYQLLEKCYVLSECRPSSLNYLIYNRDGYNTKTMYNP